jgi:hypothetical protein
MPCAADLRQLQDTVGVRQLDGTPQLHAASPLFSTKNIRQKHLHSRRILRDELGNHAR